MTENKKIQLTNDSLTNIKLMLPLLNDRARERFSDMMYGCYINGMYSKGEVEQQKRMTEYKAQTKQKSGNLIETSKINRNVSKDLPGQMSLPLASRSENNS